MSSLNIKTILNKFTIYQYMISFLLILALVSVFFYGFGLNSLIPVIISIITTTLLDLAINYFKYKKIEFPQSALISGLFIGGLLTQNLQWYVYVVAGATAILSKHLINYNKKHIFNPANLGILLASVIFGAFHSWWISSPKLLVVLFGLFIVWRLKRFDLMLGFLLTYYIASSFIEVPRSMMEHHSYMMTYQNVYLSLIEGSVIYFFAMFMLVEPKTNPTSGKKQRIIYGIFVALLFILLQFFIPQHAIVLALAIGNLFVPVLDKIRLSFPGSQKSI